MNPNIRKPDETQEQYKKRRSDEAFFEKQRIGKVIWDSSTRGAYVKSKHGSIGK